MRRLFPIVSLLLVVSCAYGPERPHNSEHPVVDGQVELLSESDIHTVIKVCRDRLHKLLVFVSITQIHVLDANEVKVFFHKAGDSELSWFRVQRLNGVWRITGDNLRPSDTTFGRNPNQLIPITPPIRNPRS